MNTNLRSIITTIICVWLFSAGPGKAQEMVKELSKLADKLATAIKEQNKKKVTVLDFTDLQGGGSELGKYIAEELTVNLVMVKRDFSVLDRANLRKILAEHKLTATGLVDPENAKKLGMFAGVDGLILGTIVPKGTNAISLTAKIITTDTAEIVGAARAEFKVDDTVQQLLSRPNKTESAEASQSGSASRSPVKKAFGDLQARVESLKLVPGDNIYGYANLTIIITNTSGSKTFGVAFPADPYNNVHLSNSRGDEFRATDLRGIETAYDQGGRFYGSITDIPPNGAITVSSKSQVQWNGRPGDYRPYRFQSTVIFGEESQGRHPDLRKYNLVLDVK